MPESAKTNTMELVVPSLAVNAELCRAAVAVFAAGLPFTLGELEQLKVAVSEAVCLTAWLAGGEIVIEVQDWGRGIADVALARQPAYTTSRDPDHIGLGFAFMEQFTDGLEVDSTPGQGTLVRLRKRPGGQTAAAAWS